jgi:thiamine kinase-like enzyme
VLHRAVASAADESFLLRYDRAFYGRWLRRALGAAGPLESVERVHEAAVERLMAEPQVVIHGELYASNALVSGSRALLVDWETAAVGPAVVDVAALTSGLPDDLAAATVAAYGDVDEIALESARLHMALRWLGWAAAWQPPAEHARDWRREAITVASRLEQALR